MTQALEEFFAGGVTAAKFEDRAYGTVIGGEIVEDPRMQQQRDYESGEPITYQDGNPAMQMVVVVQVSEPRGDDDGRRAFYIKGQMKQAVGEALRKVGAKVPARGGRLFVKYLEDKPTTLKNGRRGNDQKIYAAKYEAPSQAAAGAFFDDGAKAPTTSAGAQATGGEGGSLQCPAGVDPGVWAAMSPEQRGQLAAALGAPARVVGAPAGTQAFTEEPPF